MLESIASCAKRHGIFPLKHLGQNFIYDITLCRKIAAKAFITQDDIILEIGPGTAGLTRAILECSPTKLIAIEKDQRCIGLLSEISLTHTNFQILEEDALEIDIQDLKLKNNIPKEKRIKIVANLPYNIASILIIKWLKQKEHIESMVLMVQKEVAQRITSHDSLKSYGRLSIFCQTLASVKILFDVSPKAFYPSPKVISSVIEIIPQVNNNITKEEISYLEELTSKTFSMRRKTLKTSLGNLADLLQLPQEKLRLRPENLTPSEYLDLAKSIAKLKKEVLS